MQNMKQAYKRMLVLLSLLALLLTAVSCGTPTDPSIPEGMKLATAAGDEFRLYVPSVWTSNTAYGVSGAYFTLSEPSNVSAVKYEITPAMNDAMTAAGVADGDRLDWFWTTYCLAAVEQAAVDTPKRHDEGEKQTGETENATGDEDGSTDSLLLGGCNARRFHVSATVNGKSMHFVQVLTENKGGFFVLTYSVTDNLYSALLDNFTSIIEHFKFDEPYDPDSVSKLPTEGVDAPAGMKLASNDTVAYRFFVPASWELNRLEDIFAAYVAADRSSVSVTPYMPESEMRVGEYFKLCEELLEDTADKDGYELLSTKENVDLGGEVATAYTYRYVIGGREYRCMQVIAAHGSMIYSLTYTASPAYFDAHLDEVNAIVDAFVFR